MKFGHVLVPLFLFLCVLVWSCSETVQCQAQTLPQSEVDALKKIGEKLGKHWNFTVNPCSGTSGWVDPSNSNRDVTANVTCSACKANDCHVTSIVLTGQNLTGSLPGEFSNLTFLQVIDLSRNYLNGTIPVVWASIPLIDLVLTGNCITGRIPNELSRITTLESLYLGSNLIEGPLPQSLGNLTNLAILELTANAINGGLPESWGNLKNMIYFLIGGNPITGKIPDFIGNWTQLVELEMLGTSMEGPFPPIFYTSGNMRKLEVSDLIGGDGKFPPLQNMTGMHSLVLRNMSITDALPTYIGNMTMLYNLDLSFNALTGPIPDTLQILKYLQYLFLNNNKLTGAIPEWMLTSGIHIDMSYNSFDAHNAPCYCSTGIVNMVSSYSSTDDNSIKPCLKRNNPCSGVPENDKLFINCGGSSMTIDGNEYEDNIDIQGASYYHANGEKWAFSSSGYFLGNEDQSYVVNNVSPIVGASNANPKLYTTARLSPLSLTYYGLCLQNGNYTVNLHFAEIMFTDDQTYSAVGRRFFDVSIQDERVLRDFNIAKEANGTGRAIIKSFNAMVNSNTLVIHLQWAGQGTRNIPHWGVYGPLISAISVTLNDFKLDAHENLELYKGTFMGILFAGCVMIFLVSVFILFFWIRKDAENNELRGLELQTGFFTLKQIKTATRNFDRANKLGEGGFGPVYKGILPDGSLIAVKQLSSKSRQGNREFVNEIGIISALQHPNLVKLYGCCIEGNQLLLIYEFMENNSLANALFGPEKNQLKLDWPTRLRICLGIAQGLAYLHEETRLRIVHRDIKATNVLLDKDLNAKISDFGLARLSDENATHISTQIAGTIGYMAPEYAMRGYLTDKADVYSFGVVILETVSGLCNTSYRPKEDCLHLLDWAYILQEQGRLVELVDKSLGPNYSKEEAVMLLSLALTCTSSSPSLRPTMPAVVNIIEGKKPVPVLPKKGTGSNSVPSTWVGAFEILSHNNRPLVSSSKYNEPWMESVVSTNVEEEEDTSSTSGLISDYSH
ncbi:probable LRR receptor-like serine/threonine-protein kinase At1g53440 [Dioscorea cayenensis subsp. rotundata]|uniref:non-specific serine/threonine protein kinase n=1 Tax=Dioscorea cayennensis subsp. rotundata TaxID=55577 RepID=A0AB40ALL9_DIOCR|nr:probable LRR receptor-like serine/threonine-protein kinase At1g53440 [Dioscorea cayenensis subsp. rotundata]